MPAVSVAPQQPLIFITEPSRVTPAELSSDGASQNKSGKATFKYEIPLLIMRKILIFKKSEPGVSERGSDCYK